MPGPDVSALYRNLVASLPAPLAVINDRGKILIHNPAFDQFFGDGIIHTGKNLGSYLEEDSLAVFLDRMAALLKGNAGETEMRISARDGKGALCMLSLKACRLNRYSGTNQILCLLHDVSHFLDETQKLRADKELAEEATRSKSSFLANMSHEIRTPIHTVTGMTELILETNLDDEQKEYVQQIRFAAESLLGLINDVLDFSKIEAGKLPIEKIPFDFEAMVEGAVDMQALEAFRKGLDFTLGIPDPMPSMIMGDPVRIRQVLTNLLSNAIKFTRQGCVQVKASILDEAETPMLRIDVIDSGIGIPEEKRALLFQAFSQVDASMTRKFGGTGLGLSICSSLVGLMGGAIGVESEAGKGADFWFTIPLEPAGDAGSAALDKLEGMWVLVVDNDAPSREAARSLLESAGARVSEAPDGPAAIETLLSATPLPDVCLIDLEMPGMDGWQLASRINADRNINQVRLVLMNPPGKLGGEAKMKLLNWFDGYLAKPLKRRQTRSLLANLSSFNLDLPAADLRESIPEAMHTPESVPDAHALPTPGLVLVAEDHFVNRRLFTAILEKLGHRVVHAANGKEAVDQALAHHPAMVFMDVQMPEMNGYDATRNLRAANFRNPVIAVTANALKGDVDKCLQAGMDDYLPKPFQKKDVEAMLARWMTKGVNTEEEPPGETVFNKEFARNVFMDDTELLHSVLQEFLARTPAQIADLHSMGASEDLQGISRLAHLLKGSSLNLGLESLGNRAGDLEKACDTRSGTITAFVEAIEKAWDRSKAILDRELGT